MSGTITGVFTRIITDVGRPKAAKLQLTCIADAAAHSFPSTILNDLVMVDGFDIRGLLIRGLKSDPDDDLPPTDGTSLTIKDEYGVDLLAEAGDNFIRSATPAWTTNVLFPALITGDIILDITGNLVDSGKVVLVLDLMGT